MDGQGAGTVPTTTGGRRRRTLPAGTEPPRVQSTNVDHSPLGGRGGADGGRNTTSTSPTALMSGLSPVSPGTAPTTSPVRGRSRRNSAATGFTTTAGSPLPPLDTTRTQLMPNPPTSSSASPRRRGRHQLMADGAASGNNKENLESATKQQELKEIADLEAMAEKLVQTTLGKDHLPLTERSSPPYVFNKMIEASAAFYYYPSEKDMDSTSHVFFRRDSAKAGDGSYNAGRGQGEEDGLFVGDQSSVVTWQNWARMDHRLRSCETEGAKAWLGADKHLASRPDQLLLDPPRQTLALSYDAEGNRVVSDLNATPHDLLMDHHPARNQTSSSQDISAVQDRPVRLAVALHDIVFADHLLMSEEGRVAVEIQRLANEMTLLRNQAHGAVYEAKMMAIREAYVQFKMDQSVRTMSDMERVEFEEKCMAHLFAIQEAQARFEQHSKKERELEFTALKAWSTLKEIRQIQKYTSTTLRVTVRRESTSDDEQSEREKMARYVEMAVKDREELHLLEHARLLREYRKKLSVWQERQQKDGEGHATDVDHAEAEDASPETSGRRHRREKSKNADGSADATVDVKKKHRGRDLMPVEPIARQFDHDRARLDIETQMKVCFRQPGSPVLTVMVAQTEQVTPTAQCPKAEQLRRAQISSMQVYLRLMINGREVVKTRAISITPETFTASFANTEFAGFFVQLQTNPNDLKAELWEKCLGKEARMCSVVMEFPEISKLRLSKDQDLATYTFITSPIVVQTAATLDYYRQIVPAPSDQLRNGGGALRLILSWDSDSQGNIYAPKRIRGQRLQHFGNDVHSSENRLSSLNGPGDLSQTDSVVSAFRFLAAEKDLMLQKSSGSHFSKRNEILRLRNQRKVVSKAPVPFDDRDITKEVYEVKEEFVDDATKLDVKPVQRLVAPMSTGNLTRDSTHCLATPGLAITTDSEFLKRMRVHQVYKIVRSSQLAQRTAFESVVREEKLAEAVEGSFLDLLMMPRRPLNPMRLAREKSVAQVPTECNLVAQVMRGFNIPVRSSTAAELAPNPLSPNGDRFRSRNNLQLEDLDGKPRGISERTVRPYVEIQFQHRKVRTAAGDGPNPCWNETLTLPFEPPGMDFRPENLQVVRDNVYFNIFDEFVVDLNVDDRDRRHRINQRKERNWLGTIVVPFTTLYEHAVIDGYFHVKTPPLLNGYEKDSVDESAGVNTDETMLSLFITLEPLLKQPVVISPRFESAEDQAVLRSVKRWQSLLLPKRPVSATAIDISGKTVLACRYIRAQPPPVGMATIEQVLAFVSSIPYLDDRTTLAASIDLWSTADQMLEIGAGDEAEHAILLCNYLLSFGLKSWVVLGKGIPEGKAAYVLTEHSGQYGQTIKTGPPEQSLFGRWFASAPVEQPAVQRWSLSLLNPLSGLQYHPGDAHCPLKEISCVFNHENVWANIQEYADPARLKFDLANPLQWRPVFPRATTQTLASIQMETLLYTTPNLANIKELEKEIYQVLVSKVEKWRGRFLTKWNRTCGRVLETILPLLERKRQGDLTPLRAADLAELGRVQSSYDVRGFPLHMPFTDAAAIVEALYNTDFYSNHDNSAEFALAVHVHPYVNNVCSVWLYAASLTRKQSGISPLKAGARAVLAGVSMFRAASASASRPAAY